MGRNLSPALRRELANLDKDADSRKSAMKALKTYVKDLDSKAIPLFLEQVSETKETGSLSGEYTISLYEVLARVHGINIVPQIDSIMATIVKTLASSAGSFPLQQACSRVVPAIARYGIDPTTPENKKRHIIHSLCKPLAESLLGPQESLTSGAALCLKALVDADNWRYASDDMVNKVCQNVAVALEEKSTQTNSHMGLVMALAKHNCLIVEAYARLLVRSAMKILQAGLSEANSQKRLSAIQMVNFLMKWLDLRSIFSELQLIIEEMEKCQSDPMAFVRGAAFETLQTARRIATERGFKFEKRLSSVTESIGKRDENQGINLWGSGDDSSASPESRMIDFNFEYDSLLESPISSQVSSDLTYDRQSVHRRLWRYGNGGLDISLKDGLFSELSNGNGLSCRNVEQTPTRQQEYNANEGDDVNDFIGFQPRSPRYGEAQRSPTPSPQRPRSPINVDNIKIFTTPRKLIRSLQDPSDVDSDVTQKSLGRFRSPCSSVDEWSPVRNFDQGGLIDDPLDAKEKENSNDGVEQLQGVSESLSSADNTVAGQEMSVPSAVTPLDGTDTLAFGTRKAGRRAAFKLICSILFVLLAIFCYLQYTDDHEYRHLVPT
ncbi:hypothetical protein BT93_A1795 [Corymbia citriodora subsp. variegata]|nr:hypothetical protein BT93_A1795 [Corymbia citriodora subsp. variegata]